MNKFAGITFSLALIWATTSCSAIENLSNQAAANFPLEIMEIPEDSAQYGTHCVSVMGAGWSCIVDLSVINESSDPWTGNLSANLIADDGSKSAASDYPGDENLTGSFSQIANPGDKWEWAAHFSVAENKLFKSVEIQENNGATVATVPVCIGSSAQNALGC